ncbi:MAG TPA: phosphoribosylaminoimidazolesuccinocarboxamide synthase [Candidatus Acidoferrales bacterium]|nr:phosphoribosylaminoimidazolesuccinocarboxamide synthase [Candidatus Acidoferrales bacterium]
MNKGIEIARGKTKILYENPGQPDQLIVVQTDQISAGDGARRHEIAGKGRLAAQTTARVFRLLNLCGLPTHYLNGGEDDDDNETVVRRCNMIPLEVVTRGVAAGSFAKRNPGIARGMLLVPRVTDFFLKDDAQHDPMISPDQIVARGVAAPHEVAAMSEMARLTFDILTHAWRRRDVLLVDLKVEFGRLTGGENQGQLAIADVIDNDSWRIWPQGREELMLDKQMYRNLETVDDAALARVKQAYERVAEMTGAFPVMRPGMVAVVADAAAQTARVNEVVAALGQLGLPTVRHVASPTTTPGYVLQLVGQLEATFARLIFVAVGESDLLRDVIDAASSSPVLDGRGESARLVMECSKLLGLEDTVLYGRTLMMQANARSAIVHADAALQHG